MRTRGTGPDGHQASGVGSFRPSDTKRFDGPVIIAPISMVSLETVIGILVGTGILVGFVVTSWKKIHPFLHLPGKIDDIDERTQKTNDRILTQLSHTQAAARAIAHKVEDGDEMHIDLEAMDEDFARAGEARARDYLVEE